nr:type IV secretion system protein [uncultured Pseudomonas sp.]
MFEQTKDLFKKWLYYVLGTLFSMAMLSVVSAMVLKFTVKVAGPYWAMKLIPLGNAEGLSSQALQQGGIGLLMTLLIVSVPPMAAALWQGSMASFMHFSAFSGAASAPGPQGQPPGSYVPQQPARSDSSPYTSEAVGSPQNLGIRGGNSSVATQPTGVRGNAVNNDGNMFS